MATHESLRTSIAQALAYEMLLKTQTQESILSKQGNKIFSDIEGNPGSQLHQNELFALACAVDAMNEAQQS